MPKYRKILNSVILTAYFWAGLLAAISHAVNPKDMLDPEMANYVDKVAAQGKNSAEDFNACQITSAVQPLNKTDPHSAFTPYEITLFYENNAIIKLVNLRGGKGNELEGLHLNCVEFNDYVYLFFDTSGFESRLKFKLQDMAYVIYSSDKGQTWSPLTGLSPLSKKTKFVLPHEQFRKHLRLLGDANGHAISAYNIQDDTTYLLDPELNILRTVSVYNRLSGFEEPRDFYFYEGRIFLIRGSCETQEGEISCPGHSYQEISMDYGRTWEKKIIPYITASRLFTHEKALYHVFLAPCSSSWWKLIPAFDHSNICGKLSISKFKSEGGWTPPKTLLTSVNKLIGLYPNDDPLLVWQDLRFHDQRTCGYIPVVGCVDSGSFEGPHAIFAGHLNMNKLTVDESLIHYDPSIQYIK